MPTDATAPIPVLYVAGLGRSGSTLLERTVGQLPGMIPVGEVVHLWDRGLRQNERCGCGAAFSDCSFWSEVGQVAFGGWHTVAPEDVLRLQRRVDRTRHAPQMAVGLGSPGFRTDLRGFRGRLQPLYAAMRDVSGARILVDSSKNPSYAYVLRGVASVALRVVHVVRDPRAVAHSWSKVVARPDAPDSLMARWSPRKTAVQWETQNWLVELLRRTGTPVLTVRYEDFVRSPAGVLDELAAFSGTAIEPGLSAALRERRVTLSRDHTVSGNPLRFETGEVQIAADDRWRTDLSPHDGRTVSRLTPVGRRRYGYRAAGSDDAAAGSQDLQDCISPGG